ncbi:hypothetical protein D9M72_619810 [compost metagenome]
MSEVPQAEDQLVLLPIWDFSINHSWVAGLIKLSPPFGSRRTCMHAFAQVSIKLPKGKASANPSYQGFVRKV